MGEDPGLTEPLPDDSSRYCFAGVQWPAAHLWLDHGLRDARPKATPGFWAGSLIHNKRDLSGNLYMRNRYYDPSSGRFTQEDPIGIAGGLNTYGFANGDPANLRDAFGLSADTVKGPTPVPGSNCDVLGCELEEPTPEEIDAVLRILSWVRTDRPECVATQQAGLGMVDRGFYVYRNQVRMPVDQQGEPIAGTWSGGRWRPVLGNAPFETRISSPGVVLYLYAPQGTKPKPLVVWHEADHGVVRRYIGGEPSYRTDFTMAEPHGDRDGWARACYAGRQ